jgi:hypothetical protein
MGIGSVKGGVTFRRGGWAIVLSLAVFLLSAPSAWAQGSVEECLAQGLIEQITCLSDLAAAKKDPSLCDAAKHEGVKYQCYAVAAEKLGDWKICFDIPREPDESLKLRDLCISDVAEKAGDAALCEKIQTRNFKDSCYLKVYGKTGDEALCEKIADPGLKSLCTGEPVLVK